MDHAMTQEQQLLGESIARFLKNDYSFEARQGWARNERGFSVENWKTFAELGWLGVPFSEASGGVGGDARDVALLMERFGTGLVLEPYLATVILVGGLLERGGSEALKAERLSAIIAGRAQGALAFAEPQSRFNLADVRTRARISADGYVLDGTKTMVLNGPSADFFLVTARTSHAERSPEGISVFLVDAAAEGLLRRDFPMVDGHRASEMTLDNVRVGRARLVGEIGQGFALLEQGIDEGILAVGAEAVGCMEVLYRDTVEYCKNRKQFGQPIGKFQVLAHRMVDMFMHYEQSKSLMYTAATQLSEGYGRAAQHAVSAFKVQVGRAGRFVAQGAVQLHGGMGMTDELPIGHYFKRLTAIDALFGNADYHLKRFGRLERERS